VAFPTPGIERFLARLLRIYHEPQAIKAPSGLATIPQIGELTQKVAGKQLGPPIAYVESHNCNLRAPFFYLGGMASVVAQEVSMTDLHETNDPERKAQIDTVGWIFVAFVVVVTAIAAMAAYDANDTMVAKTTVSQVAGPPG
jgi:hypothetical protein